MKKRIPELDGLRTLMIFIVSWYHIWQQSWLTPSVGNTSLDFLVRSGYVWVDGTVVLSAFLMLLPVARAGLSARPEPASAFYRRRACRILPSYYFILLLTLFVIVLPWDLYYAPQYMVKDLFTHFTLTFTFWYDTYVATPLGAAAWTLAIEAQAWLLFPLLLRALRKKPVLTLAGMLILCAGFRGWVLWALTDYSTVVNQLINFLDVYVIGFLAAFTFAKMEKALSEKERVLPVSLAATVVFIGCVFGLVVLLKAQAASGGYAQIQRGQMLRRPLFALCFAGLILSAPFSLRPLRFLLGNPVMKFLAGISMNYYLIHQTLAVHLKRLGIPASLSSEPNIDGDRIWQHRYTLLCFGLSLLLATAITYLVEKPGGRLLRRWTEKKATVTEGD